MYLRIQVAVAILVAPSAVALAADSSVTAPLGAPFQRASYKTLVEPPSPSRTSIYSRIPEAVNPDLSISVSAVDPANASCPCSATFPSKTVNPPPPAFTPENRSTLSVVPLHLPAP